MHKLIIKPATHAIANNTRYREASPQPINTQPSHHCSLSKEYGSNTVLDHTGSVESWRIIEMVDEEGNDVLEKIALEEALLRDLKELAIY